MTIERSLSKLQAAQNPPGDHLPRGGRAGVALGKRSHTPATDADLQRYENAVMKRSGHPTFGLGADWQGMPIMHPEIRSHAETALHLGNVAGDLVIDVARASTQSMVAIGGLAITLSINGWPINAYPRNGLVSGIDIPLTLLISKQVSGPLIINVTHWAPESEPPNLEKPGFYEIGVGLLYFPGDPTAIARGYPIIRPTP